MRLKIRTKSSFDDLL